MLCAAGDTSYQLSQRLIDSSLTERKAGVTDDIYAFIVKYKCIINAVINGLCRLQWMYEQEGSKFKAYYQCYDSMSQLCRHCMQKQLQYTPKERRKKVWDVEQQS